MPLPAALLAKLQKRGLVEKSETAQPEEEEEVFAEDYDDLPAQPDLKEPEEEEKEVEEEKEDDRLVREVSACPNKWNPHHKCVDYCKEKWGYKSFKSDSDMERKRDRMLRKYPLPEGWEEVADPDTGRYYYWNTVTDQVAWLAPAHPRVTISLSAEKIAEALQIKPQVKTDTLSAPQENTDNNETEERDDDFEELENEILKEKKEEKEKERRKGRSRGRSRFTDADALDPMDPASYSDIPRGTWSTGLEKQGEAKTGVDTTASGPLYQMRPYPSPGAILRANRARDADMETE